MDKLSDLPNIGEVMAGKLTHIGVNGRDDLNEIGSIEAVLRIGEKDLSTCYSMLYALEGAIRGVRWHAIPREERAILKQSFDQAIGKN